MIQLFRRHADIIIGWLIALAGAVLYLATMERTVSFWDCGEFITTSMWLEVGHPPGAPLYQLLAHCFCLMAGGDMSRVALFSNALSALSMALAAAFLYWSLLRLLPRGGAVPRLAAVAASVLFVVCDTVWFSASESEVYALATLIAAVTLWAMLRWRSAVDDEGSGRWLLLVALLTGCGVCVHFLTLLVIPCIFVIYCNTVAEHRPGNWLARRLAKHPKAAPLLVFAGATLLLAILFLVLVPAYFALIEVAGFAGPLALAVLLMAAVAALHAKPCLQHHAAALLMLLLGLSPYLVIMLRAQAAPPLNEGNPGSGQALSDYVHRRQYEQAPLIYGRCYTAPVVDINDGKPVYAKETDMLFPRMWRSREVDKLGYSDWTTHTGHEVIVGGHPYYKPSQLDNFVFLCGYQVGYMYLRYLMWNFSGRFNDRNGLGAMQDGQFITGLPFVDCFIVGNATPPPAEMRSRAYNRYFLLPLALGIVGLIAMRRRSRADFRAALTLFLSTGLFVALYLNMPTYEPRERDYVYVLNIYTFCIWAAFGMHALLSAAPVKQRRRVMARVAAVAALAVPLLVAWQNFDDHNRHDRQTARDVARNMLNSCDMNAILLTYGDNDTFPLWYLQQVEEVRPDVAVINMSLLGTSWYGEQTAALLRRQGSDLLHAAAQHYQGSTAALRQILDRNGYRRPVYLSQYAYNDRSDRYMGRLQLAGVNYRLLPEPTTDSVDVNASLTAMMTRMGWSPVGNSHLDDISCRFIEQYLRNAVTLSQSLADGRRSDDAASLWRHIAKQVDFAAVRNLPLKSDIADAMLAAGLNDEARALATQTSMAAAQRVRFYNATLPMMRQYVQRDCDRLAPLLRRPVIQ